MLGLYIYPLPKGTVYEEVDLQKPSNVIDLFGYCGILEGIVTKHGWEFLINFYGYERLYEFDKEAMWFDLDSLEEYIQRVQYELENCD